MVQIPKEPAPPSPLQRSVPTSADVARLAGVSRATVSYVLNNTSAVRISEPTRRRVHEAAKELGYVPHAAARSLRAGHSRLVLMPTPNVPIGPLYSQFINEIQWALSRLDYTVVQHGGFGLRGDDAARAWAELRPVAVIVPGVGIGPQGVAVLKRSGAKAVVTLTPEPVEGAHALILDHAGVGHSAGRHLVERGRRRIGVVVPEEPGFGVFSQPRLAGVRRAVQGTEATVTELPLAYDEAAAARLARDWRSSVWTRCSRTTTNTRCWWCGPCRTRASTSPARRPWSEPTTCCSAGCCGRASAPSTWSCRPDGTSRSWSTVWCATPRPPP